MNEPVTSASCLNSGDGGNLRFSEARAEMPAVAIGHAKTVTLRAAGTRWVSRSACPSRRWFANHALGTRNHRRAARTPATRPGGRSAGAATPRCGGRSDHRARRSPPPRGGASPGTSASWSAPTPRATTSIGVPSAPTRSATPSSATTCNRAREAVHGRQVAHVVERLDHRHRTTALAGCPAVTFGLPPVILVKSPVPVPGTIVHEPSETPVRGRGRRSAG